MHLDILIRDVPVIDGADASVYPADIGKLADAEADNVIEGHGNYLAPGFVDVHTHDDTSVIRTSEMLPKLSQGVTTVMVPRTSTSARLPTRSKSSSPGPPPSRTSPAGTGRARSGTQAHGGGARPTLSSLAATSSQ